MRLSTIFPNDYYIEKEAWSRMVRRQSEQEDVESLYRYGTPPLILFCVISVAVNIKILISVYWIRRPLSPTLYISLSLAGADAFSSTVLGIGLVANSFVPYGLGLKVDGIECFLLGLEAVRLGAVIITVAHLTALAVNHYLGILKPLRYLSIMTRRNTTFLTMLLWILPLSFFVIYFNLVENEGFQSEGCKTKTFLYRKRFRILFSSLFFGPFVLMVCIYTHIFHIVKKHQASRLRFSRVGTSFRGQNENSESGNVASRRITRNVKALYTTLYILGSFVVGWMPGTIVYALVCEDCLVDFGWASVRVKFFVYIAINCLIISKTLINPIVYAARMHEIKVATRRMHASLRRCMGFRVNFTTSDESDRGGVGYHSSEEVQSNRRSLSRSAVCRFAKSVTVENQRSGSTRTPHACAQYNAAHGCENTLV